MTRIFKVFITVVIILTITACGEPKNNEFSFEGLRADLSNAASVGIGLVDDQNSTPETSFFPTIRRVYAAENNSKASLVKVTEDGSTETVKFLNEDNQEVTVPYDVYHLDVAGDYTFIIYVDQSKDRGDNLDRLSAEIEKSFYSHSFEAQSQCEYLGLCSKKGYDLDFTFFSYYNVMKNYIETNHYVMIHNESGKVFNLTEIFGTIDDLINVEIYDDIILLETIETLESESGLNQMHLIKQIKYNNDTQELDITVFKADVPYFVEFFTPDLTTIIYNQISQQYEILSTDFKSTEPFELDINPILEKENITISNESSENINDVTTYDSTSSATVPVQGVYKIIFAMKNTDTISMVIRIQGTNVSLLLNLDDEFNILSYTIISESLSISAKNMFKKDDVLFLLSRDKSIISIDLESLTISYFDLINNDIENCYFKEGVIYLYGNDINVINLTNNNIDVIAKNVLYTQLLFDDGEYIAFSVISGLTKIDKYLDLSDGQVYTSKENIPTKTVYSIKPIN